MKSLLIIAVCIAWLFSFSGCTYSYYYPTYQHVNVLKKKGDIYGVAAAGEEEVAYAAGYAITDNIGMIMNFKNFDEVDSLKKYDTYYWEPELVLIHDLTPIDDRLVNMYGSIHFAYGQGQMRRNQDYFSLGVGRFSMQPGIGFSNKWFDLTFSARFSRVDYDFKQLRPYDQGTNADMRNDYLLGDVGQNPFYFFEPALTFGVGYKYAKVKFQWVGANQMSKRNIEYYNDVVSFSLCFFVNAFDNKDK